MTEEKRGAERFSTQLRVQGIGNKVAGVTRDFSQSGFSFTSTAAYPIGVCLPLAVELMPGDTADKLICTTEVVGCEGAGAAYLVRLRITATQVLE